MKNLGLRKYALSILKRHNCPRDTYRTDHDCVPLVEQVKQQLQDLAECEKEDPVVYAEVFNHPKYTAEQIILEFYAIGNAEKLPRKDKYHLIFDTEHCTDGFDVGNNMGHLKDAMEDLYIQWMTEFSGSADDWDYMIYNCGCRCYRNADLIPDVDTDDIWSMGLDDADHRRIGWVTTSRMDDTTYNEYARMYGWNTR